MGVGRTTLGAVNEVQPSGRRLSPAAISAGPIVIGVAVMVVWGGTPVLTRIGLRGFAPLELALLRTVIGGLITGAILATTREAAPATARSRRLLLVSGLTGFVMFPVLFTYGQHRTSAMHGGMILAALPIVTGGYAMLLERRRPRPNWILGCLIALAGEVLLVGARAGGSEAVTSRTGDLMIAVSVLVVAMGYVAGARLGQLGYRSIATTFWGIAIGAGILVPALAYDLVTSGLPDAGAGPWAAVLFIATITTIVGYIGWYWALAHGGIARTATIQFLQPFSGLVLAAVLLGEHFTAPLVGASIAILAGVAVAQRR